MNRLSTPCATKPWRGWQPVRGRVAALLAGLAGALLAVTAMLPQTVAAQPVALSNNSTQLARIGADVSSGALTFVLDAKAKSVLVDIASTIGNLTTSIELPGGTLVNASNASSFGGNFVMADGSASSGGEIYPFTGGGTHYIYRLPAPAAGNLVARFIAPGMLTEDAAVVVQVHTESPMASRLFFTETRVVAGRPTVLAAAVFDGTKPVASAVVRVQLLSDSGLVGSALLADDGGPADGAAGDGIYSGLVALPAPGRYRAVAEISGTSDGVAFTRQSAAVVEAVRSTVTLTGTVQARGIDLNANGALDQIAIDAGASIGQAGPYRLFVHLGANGKKLVGSGDATLGAGAQTATAIFNVQDLVAQGLGKGPYSLDLVELMFLDSGNAIPADRKVNLGQIGNFQNSSFERPALAFTGGSSDRGVDTNGNGLYEQLLVQVQLDVLRAGSYQFSGRLTDVYGQQLDQVASSANLVAGLSQIEFVFNGSKIGSTGTSGPYLVDGVLVFGSGGRSLSSSAPVARTRDYAFTQFEGARRNAADLDNNGHVDCSDIAIVKASFGKHNGQAGFDARADLNLDGIINIVDLSTVTRALPIGLRCP